MRWLFLLAVACGDHSEASEPHPSTPTSDPVPAPNASSELPPWAMEFEWRADPTLDVAPNTPLRGVVNGRPFEPVSIFFEPRFGNWALVIADRRLPDPHALLPFGTESANITDLPGDLAVGTRLKGMSAGGGFWQVQIDGDDRTTSWNAPNAYALEITRWEIVPFDAEAEDALQSAGTASGRLVLVYDATDTFARAWVAGTFANVPVRYRGPPRWTE